MKPLPGQLSLPGVMDYDMYVDHPKILAFADIHLGNYRYPLREYIVRAMNEIALLANKHQPDLILFAGDAFRTRVPSASDVSTFGLFLATLAQTAPVYMIPGNHDLAGRDATTLDVYDNYPNVRLIRHPMVVNAPGVQILAMPWLPQRAMVEIGVGFTDNSIALGILLEALKDTLRPNIPKILLAHCTTLGASYSDGAPATLGSDVLWPKEWFDGFALAILGHIHKPQEVADSTFYVGSICPTSFNEANQHKSILLWESGRASREMLTRAPIFMQYTPDTMPIEPPTNSFIQIKVEAGEPEPELPDCAWGEIVRLPPKHNVRQRLGDVSAMSNEDAIAAFLAQSNKAAFEKEVIELARKIDAGTLSV